MLRRVAALLGAVVLVAGCANSADQQRQPSSAMEGMQLAGQFDGAQLSVSVGDPDVVLGDCDAGDGVDQDLCVIGRSIDGEQVALVVENPIALVDGVVLDVAARSCTGCDDVLDVAVVEVRVAGNAVRASGGQIEVLDVGSGRQAFTFSLRFATGASLTGTIDVLLPLRR